jgi:tungstate transport system permease protein
MWETILQACLAVLHLNGDVWQTVFTSLKVSVSALIVGTILGLPLGAILAIARFPGRDGCITLINTLMNVPTVIIGVLVYLLLSRTGPFGSLGILFTVPGMIIAQSLLTTPLIAAISRQTISDAWQTHRETFLSLHLKLFQQMKWILWDCRFSLIIALLAGFGRAISEVGAVMIVGGNIAHHTRTMTTAITLETSKGDLSLALSLGIVLILVVLMVNLFAFLTKKMSEKKYG